MFTCVI